MALFGKPKYTIVRLKKKEIPDGLWTKCEGCSETLYNKTLEENNKVCPKCNYHFGLTAYERINLLFDKDTFSEFAMALASLLGIYCTGDVTSKFVEKKQKQQTETTSEEK